MSWRVLHNVFSSPLEKLLVFKFMLADIQWVISLTMSIQLNPLEVLTLGDEDQPAQAFASVHVQSTQRHVLQLKGGYSFALEGKRLDIYTGKKQNTFICLQEDENSRMPIMSVALDRFKSSLPRDFQTRLRREQFLEMEVFCVYNHSDPGQMIQKRSPQHSIRNAYSDEDDPNHQVPVGDSKEQTKFVLHKADFPSVFCDPEELLSDLERNILSVQELLEKGRLQSTHLDVMCDRMTSLVDDKV